MPVSISGLNDKKTRYSCIYFIFYELSML